MVPIKPPGYTNVFHAPDNWDAEKYGPCDDLYVIAKDGYVASIWKPDAEELQALNEGGFIQLSVAGKGMPPVLLQAVRILDAPDTKA